MRVIVSETWKFTAFKGGPCKQTWAKLLQEKDHFITIFKNNYYQSVEIAESEEHHVKRRH